MRSQRFLCVAALGMACSTVSCGGDEPPPKEQDAAVIEACGPKPPNLVQVNSFIGDTGTNGMPPYLFHEHRHKLDEAIKHPIVKGKIAKDQIVNGQMVNDVSMDVSDDIKAILLGDDENIALAIFEKVVECVAPEKLKVTVPREGQEPAEFEGGGILTTTTAWLDGEDGLCNGQETCAARNDLLSCMATLLNPLEKPVPILVSGSIVNKDKEEDTWCYQVPEAVFQVREEPDPAGRPRLVFTAWPLDGVKTHCSGDDIGEVLKARVCGHQPDSCDFELGDDIKNDCDFKDDDGDNYADDGVYSCSNQPGDNNEKRAALQTALGPDGLKLLYRCD